MRARLVAVAVMAASIATSGCGGGQPEWLESAPPAEHGFPADLAKRIDSFVDERGLDLRAVLVVTDDRLVAERYYHGVTRHRFLHLYSATKSVTGLLVGAALADGKLAGLDETLADALPPDLLAHADDKVRSMTLRALLSMTTGLGESLSWMTSADWDRAIVENPGFLGTRGSFSYSTPGTQLLSAAVEHATGESLLRYARRKLFEPLGILTQPPGKAVSGPGRETEPTFGWPTTAGAITPAGPACACAASTWPSSASSTSTGASGRESGWCRARGSTRRRGRARTAGSPKATRTGSTFGSRPSSAGARSSWPASAASTSRSSLRSGS